MGSVADDDPGRGGDDDLPPAERERLGQAGQDPLGDGERLRLVVEVLEEGDELVAAEAAERVADP